jgi:hypothetical protein
MIHPDTPRANEKAPGVDSTEGFAKNSKDKRKSIAKSTTTTAQYATVIKLLRGNRKNTMELRRSGVMMPAARIKELNDKHGYSIATADRQNLFDEQGFLHPRVAVYELVNEPPGNPLGLCIDPEGCPLLGDSAAVFMVAAHG